LSMDVPETRYVGLGNADVAYQVFGDGSRDILFSTGIGQSIEMFWQWPPNAEHLRRLASFSRVIFFDRRGTGLSDSMGRNALPTWEEWAEDMAAVLDAAGSRQAAVCAWLDVGPTAMLFAAMHPERVDALVLVNTAARLLQDTDYPIGLSSETIDAISAAIAEAWGTADQAAIGTPSMAGNPEWARFLAATNRASMTPRTAAAQANYVMRSNDVRQALPLIGVPTLVLHTVDNEIVPIECGRYIAQHLPDATLIELPGGDLGPWAHLPTLADEIGRFLTGEQPAVEIDRILTTMLFTDIVGSTERAATLGDERWRTLLDSHDRVVRDQLRRFRGAEIKTTGDGFLASFDGPARAIRCAREIVHATAGLGLDIRIGIHTGECEVRGGDDLGGLAVHIAARVSALAEPRQILVSRTVVDLVAGSGIDFADRGEHDLKGVPGTWQLYSITP
jgi:class 3 adenylate cyclase/alpha-beta hydrolase superfamily lysophospholipase